MGPGMSNFYIDPNGNIHELSTVRPQPVELNDIGVIATLNAILGIWSLKDAANIAGVSEQDLVDEAIAWSVAQENNEV